jgi:hypothetical protein
MLPLSALVALALTSTPDQIWAAAHPAFTVVGATTHSLEFSQRSVTFIATEPPGATVIAVDEQGIEVDPGDLFIEERKKRLNSVGVLSDDMRVFLGNGTDENEVITVVMWPRKGHNDAPDRSLGEGYLLELAQGRAVSDRTQLVQMLNYYGLPVETATFLPVVQTSAPRWLIRDALAFESSVDWIDLSSSSKLLFGVAEDAVDFPGVYAAGIFGAGQTVAIVEPGKVHLNPSNPDKWWNTVISPGLLGGANSTLIPNSQDAQPLLTSNDQHATRVASVLAGSFPQHSSGVPQSRLFVGNPADPEMDFDYLRGYEWVQGWPRARVINNSFGFNRDAKLDVGNGQTIDVDPTRPYFLDQVADWYSRILGTSFVMGSGNTKRNVVGWLSFNNIKVGGYDPRNTKQWENDRHWDEDPNDPAANAAQFRNPPLTNTVVGTTVVSTFGDRELPEVVAVSTNAGRSVGRNEFPLPPNVAETSDVVALRFPGTSFAAPQVTAMAAMLMESAPELRVWPEAVKAIVMASAINPIRGTNGASRTIDFETKTGRFYGQDRKTGAGGVWAAGATGITAGSRGRYYKGLFSPQANGHISETFLFPVCRSRMRVVLSYSVSYGCNFCFDDLDRVGLAEPGVGVVRARTVMSANSFANVRLGVSRSLDNNYQILDFPSPAGPVVTVDVRGASSKPEYYGVAMFCYDEDSSGLPVVWEE